MSEITSMSDTWYVNTKKNDATSLLGFVVPVDKSFSKRKETVDGWVKGYNRDPVPEGKTFENTPQTFKLDVAVSRWSTSNKWFRVIDPRGWHFEISADNLVHLLQNLTIEKGEIKTPLIYTQGKQKLWLTWEDSPEIEQYKNVDKFKVKDLEIGDWFKTKRGDSGIYIGKYYTVCGSISNYLKNYNKTGTIIFSNAVKRSENKTNITEDGFTFASPGIVDVKRGKGKSSYPDKWVLYRYQGKQWEKISLGFSEKRDAEEFLSFFRDLVNVDSYREAAKNNLLEQKIKLDIKAFDNYLSEHGIEVLKGLPNANPRS